MKNDVTCARVWAHNASGAIVTSSDQGDQAVLEASIDKCGTDFDIIIDNLRQMVVQQTVSLQRRDIGRHARLRGPPDELPSCVRGGGRGTPDIMTDCINRIIEGIMVPEESRQAPTSEDVEDIIYIGNYMGIRGFFQEAIGNLHIMRPVRRDSDIISHISAAGFSVLNHLLGFTNLSR